VSVIYRLLVVSQQTVAVTDLSFEDGGLTRACSFACSASAAVTLPSPGSTVQESSGRAALAAVPGLALAGDESIGAEPTFDAR
jgi:hypothetical protein